eukprot:COSAG06_NODE_33020_length_496_cov_2.350126_1_plen_36_part_01
MNFAAQVYTAGKKRAQSDRFCLCILQADVFEAIDWF